MLFAALDAGVYIPHFCYHPSFLISGSASSAIVEIDGERRRSYVLHHTREDEW